MASSNSTYEKDFLIASEKFKSDRDLLQSLLKNDTKYSVDEVSFIIKAYKERMI